jgi:hypothetical protein
MFIKVWRLCLYILNIIILIMKSTWIALILSIIFVMICGCAGTGGTGGVGGIGGGSLSPGIYMNEKDLSRFVTIGSDKSFIQESTIDVYFGVYNMGGDVITVEGDCKDDKSLANMKFCGNKFIMYYKMSGNNTFCKITGKDGSLSADCYILKSS